MSNVGLLNWGNTQREEIESLRRQLSELHAFVGRTVTDPEQAGLVQNELAKSTERAVCLFDGVQRMLAQYEHEQTGDVTVLEDGPATEAELRSADTAIDLEPATIGESSTSSESSSSVASGESGSGEGSSSASTESGSSVA